MTIWRIRNSRSKGQPSTRMSELSFPLKGEFIELYKLLKVTGLAESGGMAKLVIANSQVKVDGQIETRKGCKIRRGQRVEFSGGTILVE